jgi:CheY-like chemotaxis protein
MRYEYPAQRGRNDDLDTGVPEVLRQSRTELRRDIRLLSANVLQDNRDAADTLREVLEVSGHHVEVAYDGEEGLLVARRAPLDVVICDIGLPGMDGYGVARAIRADRAVQGLTLIAVTGYASVEDRRRAIEAGFDHHFGKPADLTKLTKVLDAVPRGGGPSRLA